MRAKLCPDCEHATAVTVTGVNKGNLSFFDKPHAISMCGHCEQTLIWRSFFKLTESGQTKDHGYMGFSWVTEVERRLWTHDLP